MCAGQHGIGVAISVEGVFDDVVSGAVDDMDEKLSGEGRQIEPGPNLAAVHGYRTDAGG